MKLNIMIFSSTIQFSGKCVVVSKLNYMSHGVQGASKT